MRVLVINDFVRKGGAEEVYRVSVDVLRARNDVVVETFDEEALRGVENKRSTRAWSPAAARALVALLERFRPQRILVHNYHNLLSCAILPVLARYKRRSGCGLYLTAHDYHLVFYNPSLQIYSGGRAQPLYFLWHGRLPANALRSPRHLHRGQDNLRRRRSAALRRRPLLFLLLSSRSIPPRPFLLAVTAARPVLRLAVAAAAAAKERETGRGRNQRWRGEEGIKRSK